jgi:structural maintenance of chromosomes protein 6
MKVSLRQTNKTIADYEAQIRLEKQRLAEKNLAKHEQTLKDLEDARQKVTEAEARLTDILKRRSDKLDEAKDAKDKGMPLQQTREQIKDRINNADHRIRGCHEQEKNKLAHLGNDVQGVLKRIQNTRWYGETPIGPLGMYVKVKDPKWAPLLRVLIGSHMFAFVCTDPKDRAPLRKILDQSKKYVLSHKRKPLYQLSLNSREAQIMISERDIFDYSSGEPPQDYTTILRVLDVSSLFCVHEEYHLTTN